MKSGYGAALEGWKNVKIRKKDVMKNFFRIAWTNVDSNYFSAYMLFANDDPALTLTCYFCISRNDLYLY